MYDTFVTIVGNVLHEPEWRRTTNTGVLVTTFKIASTSRRLNRETGQWADGNSLRVRVNCWRTLASNVKNSVTRGDPLIVTGRLFTRDWVDEQGAKRTMYELDAIAVGHDLSRGRAVFERIKGNTATSAVEDAQAAQRVGGEATEPVPDHEAPSQFDDTPFDAAFDRPPPMAPPPAAAAVAGDENGDEPPAGGDGAGAAAGESAPSEPDAESGAGRRRVPRRARVPA